MTQVLLLNADYRPVRVISLQRALSLIFKDRVDLVQDVPGRVLKSPSTTIKYPSILRLKVYRRVPQRRATWSRRGVFSRDHWKCQYCGCDLDRNTATIDHIIPKSRCGSLGIKSSTWNNTCASCPKCNRRKNSKTPEEAGMKFFFPDFTAKTPRTNYVILSGDIPSEWKSFLEF